MAPIRKDDIYGGYCARLDAIYDTIITPLSIDISTGDIITVVFTLERTDSTDAYTIYAMQNEIVDRNRAQSLYTGNEKKGTRPAFTMEELR